LTIYQYKKWSPYKQAKV